MCFFGGGSKKVMPMPSPPSRTDMTNQQTAEDERLRLSASTRGFASTILTGGLGIAAPSNVRGVALGV